LINGQNISAIIPARGGSKGIKNKNIKNFCGIPLLAHSILQARDSNYVDRVIVSTEDSFIKKISLEYGAEVPFDRPKKLASDHASGIDVALHAIEQIKSDIFIILQPTSPLRTVKDIDGSIEMFIKKNAKIVISASKLKNYDYSFLINEKGQISNDRLKEVSTNRQNYDNYFAPNGAIFIAYTEHFKIAKSFLGAETFVYKMPLIRSIDIDEMDDWQVAKILFLNSM
jgi:CMP-N-acetylneuraminic acid synthetase